MDIKYNILSFCTWKELLFWKSVSKKFCEICIMCIKKQQRLFKEKMLQKLNIVAPTYHSGLGLTYNSIGFPLCESLNDVDLFNLIDELLSKKYIKIKKYKTITQKNCIEIFDYIEDNDIYYKKQYIDNLVITKIPFKKVI